MNRWTRSVASTLRARSSSTQWRRLATRVPFRRGSQDRRDQTRSLRAHAIRPVPQPLLRRQPGQDAGRVRGSVYPHPRKEAIEPAVLAAGKLRSDGAFQSADRLQQIGRTITKSRRNRWRFFPPPVQMAESFELIELKLPCSGSGGIRERLARFNEPLAATPREGHREYDDKRGRSVVQSGCEHVSAWDRYDSHSASN
ncbi:hypothetical protein AMC83_PD00158 (plasmid) [Rhizobium phaseoli]|nr:hypothetical protein AMK02_PC00163 [Rhizobium sp. N731]ANL18652.1 hypothetical protein AMJ97_PC00160 [Rhizobium sp. N1314]ANL75194.1 hypothetical protein AMC83_PD00158 [Rhizobium phaseoli]